MKTLNTIINIKLLLGVFLFLILIISCEDPEPFACEQSMLTLEIIKTKNPDCGLSNGEITVAASGGTEPYKYAIDNGPFSTNPFFENVQPVLHALSVKDKNGCVITVNYFLAGKDPFQVVSYTTPSGCDGNNGTIRLVPLGGVPPYKYQLGENNDNYQETPNWENLRAGRYSVWVEDINECFFGIYATVQTGVSFNDEISTIIDAKCNTASCHGGSISPDFRNYSAIKINASSIKNLISTNQMPPGEPLSGAEKNLIVCWIDDGTPKN